MDSEVSEAAVEAALQQQQQQQQQPQQSAADSDYDALLLRARATDFRDYRALDLLYVSGRDPLGRPIVVFVASRLPARTLDMEQCLLFAIHTLHDVVREPYVLVFVGSDISAANRPSFQWLRRAYALFQRAYKKNIQKLYMIQPTRFIRMVLKLTKVVVSEKFWKKLHVVEDVSQLHQFISPEQLRLPESCYAAAPLRKGQRHVLFGVTLQQAAESDPHPSGVAGGVALLVRHLQACAGREGLFRISGSEGLMRTLRADLENGTATAASLAANYDDHSVCGVLKQFVRELRAPPLPPASYPFLAEVSNLTDASAYVTAVSAHLQQLPLANRRFLAELFNLLILVAAQAVTSKMDYSNLAICLAPHLCHNPAASPATALKDAGTQAVIVRKLLESWPAVSGTDASLAPHKSE